MQVLRWPPCWGWGWRGCARTPRSSRGHPPGSRWCEEDSWTSRILALKMRFLQSKFWILITIQYNQGPHLQSSPRSPIQHCSTLPLHCRCPDPNLYLLLDIHIQPSLKPQWKLDCTRLTDWQLKNISICMTATMRIGGLLATNCKMHWFRFYIILIFSCRVSVVWVWMGQLNGWWMTCINRYVLWLRGDSAINLRQLALWWLHCVFSLSASFVLVKTNR